MHVVGVQQNESEMNQVVFIFDYFDLIRVVVLISWTIIEEMMMIFFIRSENSIFLYTFEYLSYKLSVMVNEWVIPTVAVVCGVYTSHSISFLHKQNCIKLKNSKAIERGS